jgi:chromosome segregation ATPase
MQKKAIADELDSYRDKINLAKSNLSGRTATVDAREREIRNAEERLAALRGDVEAAEAEMKRLDLAIAERGDVEGELALAEGKLTELRNDQATKLAVLGTLANKIDRQRSLAEEDQQGLLTLQSGMQTTEERLGERQAEIEDAEERLAGLVAEADQSEARLTVVQQEIEASQASLELRRPRPSIAVRPNSSRSKTASSRFERSAARSRPCWPD